MNIRDLKGSSQRRQFLEKTLKLNLNNISQGVVEDSDVEGKNTENLIGSTQIPLGIAGPLRIINHSIINRFIPIATTEGALVASVSRGCKAINLSGGVVTLVEEVGVTRGPVFKTSGILEGKKLKTWIEKNFSSLKKEASKTSSHLKLLKTDFSLSGKYLFIRFYFDSGDAMGMNMATIAAEKICSFIEKKTKAKCVSIAGNFDIDKKAAWLNFISGRGKRVWAQAVIKKDVVREVLKTSVDELVGVVNAKIYLGSIASGSIGFNAHFANIIAGIFAATGQDIAHSVEGSLGITDADIQDNGDLYFCIYLPCLMIGTVGGGTNLPTQSEALQIMGVKGTGKVLEFASIIAGALLAGELSLIASQAQGSLAKAHIKLGRGKK